MYKLSVIVPGNGITPAAGDIKAKKVIWDDVDTFDLVNPEEAITATAGSETSLGSGLWWWHMLIVDTTTYSIYNDDVLIEGYEGKHIETGNTATAVALNTTHAALRAGNIHEVTKAEVSLGNVTNEAPGDMVSTGLTETKITDLGMDIDDLVAGKLQFSKLTAPTADAPDSCVIYMDDVTGDLKVYIRWDGGSGIATLADFSEL